MLSQHSVVIKSQTGSSKEKQSVFFFSYFGATLAHMIKHEMQPSVELYNVLYTLKLSFTYRLVYTTLVQNDESKIRINSRYDIKINKQENPRHKRCGLI